MIVVMLKKKSNVFKAFKKYLAKVERELGKKIIKVRSDNAKEYISKEINQFLEVESIKREFSVEYKPEQNDVVEQANRTIEEMTHTCYCNPELQHHYEPKLLMQYIYEIDVHQELQEI